MHAKCIAGMNKCRPSRVLSFHRVDGPREVAGVELDGRVLLRGELVGHLCSWGPSGGVSGGSWWGSRTNEQMNLTQGLCTYDVCNNFGCFAPHSQPPLSAFSRTLPY